MKCLHAYYNSYFCNASVSSTKTEKKNEKIQDFFVSLKALYFYTFILCAIERLQCFVAT